MLIQEAEWLNRAIMAEPAGRVYPMLNIGSSTQEFRTVVQPWIDRLLFAPAQENGLSVVHMDIKTAPGVDIVGDLADHAFLKKLASMKFRSVLCANLLEHVTNREEIARAIETVVGPEGLIIVTCPHSYPYHADPIDTGYRPTPEGLAQLFPSGRMIQGEIVDCGTHAARLLRNPKLLLNTIARLCLPFYKPLGWWQLLVAQTWLFRRFKVSCVVIQKTV